jgi:branched-chain amino acid transport system permease protein
MDYFLHLSILICIYVILSQSLCLVAGYSGQISLAHAGFYGIGAYTSALLSISFGFTLLISITVALLIAGLIAYIVSNVAVKTIDDYYIIITLGIQVVLFSIMNNWQVVTKGPLGLSGIPPAYIFGFTFENKLSFLIITVIFTALVWFVLNNITKSPFGRILIGLSEDEIYCKSLGKNVYCAKIVSFVIGGMLASIAGVLYAHYITYIDPTSFTIDESIFILCIVIIGGMRSLRGVFIATLILVILPEVLRYIGIPSSIAANIRQMIYGIALITVVFIMGKNGRMSKKSLPSTINSKSFNH